MYVYTFGYSIYLSMSIATLHMERHIYVCICVWMLCMYIRLDIQCAIFEMLNYCSCGLKTTNPCNLGSRQELQFFQLKKHEILELFAVSNEFLLCTVISKLVSVVSCCFKDREGSKFSVHSCIQMPNPCTEMREFEIV